MGVVVAVDESPGAWSAIALAASEAKWRHTPLIAVMAYRADRVAGVPAARPLSTLRTEDEDRAAAQAAVQDAVRQALGAEEAASVRLCVVAGLAGRAIVDTARQERAQLIVLAARSGISVLPGTVSQYVLRNSPCPVLVVPAGRQPARQAAD